MIDARTKGFKEHGNEIHRAGVDSKGRVVYFGQSSCCFDAGYDVALRESQERVNSHLFSLQVRAIVISIMEGRKTIDSLLRFLRSDSKRLRGIE